MRLLSLFDGEGGFPLAATMNGIEPIYASEIEPFPIAVTRSRFPNMKHLGNVTEINGAEMESVDIISFGSPCQDMSVAGKRAGLKHDEMGDEETTRSGLFFEAIRIIKEMRKTTNGRFPRFAVWENVPGAFSSNGGRDFLAVLQALASVADNTVSIPEPKGLRWAYAGCIVGNGYSIAWRTYDAQYWGVPQRRKRIYLVADFNSERAAEILFEPYSLRGDIAESGEARKRAAEDVAGRADGSAGVFGIVSKGNGEAFLMDERHMSLSTGGGQAGQGYPAILQPALFMAGQGAKAGSIAYSDSVAPTLKGCASGLNQAPSVVAFTQNQRDEVRDLNGVAGALAAEPGMKQQTYICEPQPVIALQANGIDRADTAGCNGAGWREDQSYTLNTIDRHAVCYPSTVGTLAANAGGLNRPAGNCNETDFCVVLGSGKEHVGTLMSNASTKLWLGNQEAFSGDYSILEPQNGNYIVRRLMPVETLRLQGYPDWWHDLAPFDGDVEFWESVRKTWSEVNGKQYRPLKTIDQLEKWYNGLRTDAAEYKADGNSLAIPCAEYVIRRISEFTKEDL